MAEQQILFLWWKENTINKLWSWSLWWCGDEGFSIFRIPILLFYCFWITYFCYHHQHTQILSTWTYILLTSYMRSEIHNGYSFSIFSHFPTRKHDITPYTIYVKSSIYILFIYDFLSMSLIPLFENFFFFLTIVLKIKK